jgi:hypothetical protein
VVIGGGGGTLGFVDVINCGFDKLRQELNSTVKPRYAEHLETIRIIHHSILNSLHTYPQE